MSYRDRLNIRLYKYENNSFVLQAIIDDFQEISFERNLYQAGTFTISINYNIPNALKFERGMFVQFGNDPYDFGEIITITDTIGADGKGSQIRTITGYDSRYILKRRVIKNMNSNGLWVMTAKGELCLRNLIKDQCGSGAEAKRQLPIINTIPASADAIGKEYSVSEQFTNLYEVCKTIATQSEIGWRLAFDGTSLTLECYEGTDRSQTVQFSTSFDSLANGEFSDSSESFSNAIYVGGKGDNEERDIYEGENGTPSGLDRFESFDNQSQMTTESEYEAEALSMLTQYGQTIQMSGNGLAKCPYIYKEQYDVGDLITVAFSGKSAVVQILSVTEHWTWGNYNIQFSFGKPQNNLSEQLQLMLRKIQSASNKEKATESVKWYNVANVNSMNASDVTFNTIGFTGTMTANKTFTLYLDNEKTGAKSYNIYVKNLSGNYTLTLTTGRAGKTNYVLKGGVNLTGRILVDDEGNITSQSVTATSVIESGNNQPATSGGVADAYGKIKQITGTNFDVNNCYINKLVNATTVYNILQREILIPNAPDVGRSANFNIITFQIVYDVVNALRLIQVAIPQVGGNTTFVNKIFVRQGFKDLGSAVQWGDWELQSLPTAPTTDGTYNLQCSVVNGAPTLEWEEGLYYKDFTIDCSYSAGAVGTRGSQVLRNASVDGYSIVSFRIQYIASSANGLILPFLNNVDSQLYVNAYRTIADAVTNSCIIRVFYKKGTINTFPLT